MRAACTSAENRIYQFQYWYNINISFDHNARLSAANANHLDIYPLEGIFWDVSLDTGTDTRPALYLSVAEALRKQIGEGDYRPGQLIGSEHELARTRTISRMTVRRASELLIHEGLIERRPGKGLFVKASQMALRQVQVIAGNLAWEPCLKVSQGVQTAGRPLGIRAQLYDAHGDVDLDLEMIRQLPSSDMCGAIIISFHSSALNESIYQLKAEGFPFVLVDQRLHDIDVDSVMADNYSGGMQAAQLLLRHGHRRIGFLGDLNANTTQDRLAGMRDAIGDAGIAFDRSLVTELPRDTDRLGDWSATVEQRTRDVMSRPHPPTALFCSCDAVARSAFRSLNAMGLSIPDDVSVVGFDDDPLAGWLSPALSTIRQPFLEMGNAAVELLCKRMSDSTTRAEQRLLPVTLLERGSVGPVR
jgi:DNA-binding LacI/PurR family transcriptional regulator